MKFTKIPETTFQNLQLNAGILVESFDPTTGEYENIIGATTGGNKFEGVPSFLDFGEDIDNCPKNMMELKKLENWEVKMTGSFATLSSAQAKMLVGAGDLTDNKITPRNDVLLDDFTDVWWVGDYSDKNGDSNGGFIAIHLLNSLSTGGFKMEATDKAKGKFEFEFTGHYSMDEQDKVPFEIYVKSGEAEPTDYEMTITSVAGTTSGKSTITADKTPATGESYVYQTGYSLAIPRKGVVLAGSGWSAWDGTSEIDGTTGMDIVVAIIDADNKSIHAGKTVMTVKADSRNK